jgi:hypothetical protein
MESSADTSLRSANGNRTLVIMAKAPRPGMVKTRLTPCLPVEAVADFYRCLLQDTMALARSLNAVQVAIMCPAADVDELTQLAGDGVEVVPQTGQGLAAGLISVFAHFATAGQRVIAFDSDSPHLPAPVLVRAFETLRTHDVVVGPTHDGGYYLVGAKTAHPAFFGGDALGTESALDALLARARALQLSVGFTEPFYDIDVAEDLARIAADLQRDPDRAPRTAAWLRKWRRGTQQLRMGAGGR